MKAGSVYTRIMGALLIWILVFLAGCGVNKLISGYDYTTKPDITNGKWLINHIETDLHLKANRKLESGLLKKLKRKAGNSIIYIENFNIPELGQELIHFDADIHKLRIINENTDFDYFFNSRIIIEENVESSELMNNKLPESDKYIIINFEIYDLESLEVIFSQEFVKPFKLNKKISNRLSSKKEEKMINRAMIKSIKEFFYAIEI